MKRIFAAVPALATLLWCYPAPLAAAPRAKARESADQRVTRSANPKAGQKAAASAANVIAEVLGKGFNIPAGGSMTFDATSDFTGAEHASVSVKAVSGSDIATQNFQIWVYWAMPGTDFWAANDVITGDMFNFFIQGGGVVPVFGPELRLVVQNAGTTAINFDQLTVYAVRTLPAPAVGTVPTSTP